MSRYLRQRTALETIKDALAIYARNVFPLLSAFLLTLPFSILRDYVALNDYDDTLEALLNAAAISASWLVSVLLVLIVVTVLVSNICLGNKPSLRRAFRWAKRGMFLRMFATYAVIFSALTLGVYIMQVVINSRLDWWVRYPLSLATLSLLLAFYARVMFIPCVMALERENGFIAFERSRELGRDFYLRNALLVLLTGAVAWAVLIAIYLIQLFSRGEGLSPITPNVGMTLIEPISSVCTVLLYYEMRVRKEGFDQQMMSEELSFGRMMPFVG